MLAAIFSAYYTYMFLNGAQSQAVGQTPQTVNTESSQLKAAIVDQLGLTVPNQAFIQTATDTLEQAGYKVYYYPGNQVTVEFYRNLPTYGYSLIILRTHSACPHGEFFTSEPYSTRKYVHEQMTNRVGKVSFYSDTPPFYFGISPFFVRYSMIGDFNCTTIIMMGCHGLKYMDMAEAFRQKNARVYISWNEEVSASHTDQATTFLLQQLILRNETIKQAVENTMKEVGPDPHYKSTLTYYPLTAGSQNVEIFKSPS